MMSLWEEKRLLMRTISQFSSTARMSQGLFLAFKIMSFLAQATVGSSKAIYFLSSSKFPIEIQL